MANAPDIRATIKQHLLTDRLFGLRSVPLVVDTSVLTAPPRGIPEPSASRGESTSRSSGMLPVVDAGLGDDPSLPKAERLQRLDERFVRGCTRCALSGSRTQTVFGQGNPDARLVFVGEAPGFEEDRQGLAFVGRAGQLLTKIIGAMTLSRDDVFICNVLKCRPPNNRDPEADEILACSPFLRLQLQIIEPDVIIALGSPAAKTLLNTAQSIGKLRGRFHDYFPSGATGVGESIPLMPTYHPAYLLRNPAEKRKTWADVQIVMERLGLERP